MMGRNFGTKKVHLSRAKSHKTVCVLSASDPKYWERLLTRSHLSMESGHHKWLDYGHRVSELDYDGARTYRVLDQVTEHGDEWPISLS